MNLFRSAIFQTLDLFSVFGEKQTLEEHPMSSGQQTQIFFVASWSETLETAQLCLLTAQFVFYARGTGVGEELKDCQKSRNHVFADDA